jgi:hypothetical protein
MVKPSISPAVLNRGLFCTKSSVAEAIGLRCSPHMFDALANEQKARPKNVEALQNRVPGGDNLSPRLQQRFEKAFGVKLLNLIARPRRVRASHPGRGRFALAPESKSNSSIGLAERRRAQRAGCYRILGESIVNCPAQ